MAVDNRSPKRENEERLRSLWYALLKRDDFSNIFTCEPIDEAGEAFLSAPLEMATPMVKL